MYFNQIADILHMCCHWPWCSSFSLSHHPRVQPSAQPPGEVHPRQVFLHRPGVQERDPGRHPPGRVPSDRGRGGRLRTHTGRPHGHPPSVLHQIRSAGLHDTVDMNWLITKKPGTLVYDWAKWFLYSWGVTKHLTWNRPKHTLISITDCCCCPQMCFWSRTNLTSVASFPGITKLRFKPAYNPYTEPSMEVFSYHEGRVQFLQIIHDCWHSFSLTGCCFPSLVHNSFQEQIHFLCFWFRPANKK